MLRAVLRLDDLLHAVAAYLPGRALLGRVGRDALPT